MPTEIVMVPVGVFCGKNPTEVYVEHGKVGENYILSFLFRGDIITTINTDLFQSTSENQLFSRARRCGAI